MTINTEENYYHIKREKLQSADVVLYEASDTATENLLIAAALIGAIRILAYYRNEISKDIAKLFPFIALALFLLSPGVFDSDNILRKLSEIPLLLNNVVYFIIVIFAIEIVLRVFYMTYEFWRSEDERMAEKVRNRKI